VWHVHAIIQRKGFFSNIARGCSATIISNVVGGCFVVRAWSNWGVEQDIVGKI
jgi:hypothetical protein